MSSKVFVKKIIYVACLCTYVVHMRFCPIGSKLTAIVVLKSTSCLIVSIRSKK
jgi:hypothetical protein